MWKVFFLVAVILSIYSPTSQAAKEAAEPIMLRLEVLKDKQPTLVIPIVSKSAHEQNREPCQEANTQLKTQEATWGTNSFVVAGIVLLIIAFSRNVQHLIFPAEHQFIHRTPFHKILFRAVIAPNAP